MGFNPLKILKSLIIRQEGTLTPSELEIMPGGTAGTKTTLVGSQTTNVTITLPNSSASLVTETELDAVETMITDHIADPTGAHTASAITNVPSGNLVATNVQAALNELQSEIDGINPDAANKTLSNLTAPTAINQDLLPDSSSLRDLGSLSNSFGELHIDSITGTGDLILTAQAGGIDVSNKVIKNVASPTTSTDATNRGYVDAADNLKLNLSGGTLTGPLILNADPTGTLEAATKQYVDSVSAGLDPKASCRVATTTSLGGSYATTPNNGQFTGAATTVDSVSLTIGDRVLVKDQVDQKQNGIYVYTASGQFTRAPDQDGTPAAEVSSGNYSLVTAGTLNVGKGYTLLGNGILTLNTDNLVWTAFSGASSGATTALDNLSAVAINTSLLPGANNSIDLGSSSLRFKDAYVQGTTNVGDTIVSNTTTLSIQSAASATGAPSSAMTVRSGNNTSTGLSGNLTVTTGTSSGNLSGNLILDTGVGFTGKGKVQLNGSTTELNAPTNLVQGKTAVPVSGQQSLTIPSTGVTEGLPILTASDATTRRMLVTGMEGLPQAMNFIMNGDAEGKLTSSTSILVPYADAAGAAPVDGTGGSPTVTTSVTTLALAGSKAYQLTKPSSNTQGEGWAIPFTIPIAAQAKVNTIKFDYLISGGSYNPGTTTTISDVVVYIYDVTNSVVIQPSNYQLKSTAGVLGQFQAEFQTASNGASYRLCLHVGTTNSAGYGMVIDNVIVTPNQYLFGSPITDWTPYTPTFTNLGTVTSPSFFYRRVGDNLEIQGRAVSGTVVAAEVRISLPPGFTTDSTKVTQYKAFGNFVNGGAGAFAEYITASPGLTYITVGQQASGVAGLGAAAGNQIIANATPFAVHASIPCAGLSSGVQMADQTTTRIVDMSANKTGGSTTANTTIAAWNTAVKDSHAAFNPTTGVYTVAVPGDYYVSGQLYVTTGSPFMDIRKNGTVVKSGFNGSLVSSAYCFGLIPNCVAGDQITLTISTSSTVSSTTAQNQFDVYRISGPDQIAASEKVLFSGYIPSVASLTANVTNMALTALKDTHSAWNGTQFTVPISGDYEISGTSIANTTGTFSAYVSGTINRKMFTVTASDWRSGTTLVTNLNAGDILSIRSDTAMNVSGNATVASASVFAIKRIPGSN